MDFAMRELYLLAPEMMHQSKWEVVDGRRAADLAGPKKMTGSFGQLARPTKQSEAGRVTATNNTRVEEGILEEVQSNSERGALRSKIEVLTSTFTFGARATIHVLRAIKALRTSYRNSFQAIT